MGEQLFRQSLSLALTLWIARQYGPTDFGNLSFSLAVISIFGIFNSLGLNRILVREFARSPDAGTQIKLLKTGIQLRLLAAVFTCVSVAAICLIATPEHYLLIGILSLGYFFNAFDAIDLYHQANLSSRKVSKARAIAFVASSCVKATILMLHLGIEWIAVACLVDWIFASVALRLTLGKLGLRLTHSSFDPATAKVLLRESWPEIIAGFSGIVFLKIDQVMLQMLRDSTEVANMAISARLTEAWYFIPSAIVASAYPEISRLVNIDPADARLRFRQLLRMLVALSAAVAIGITFAAQQVINILYGITYAQAAEVLVIQVWCGVFMSFGIASGIWLIAHGLGRINLHRNLSGAAINVVLNLLLIPPFGAVGAAWATLVAFATAYFIYDFIDPRMRGIAFDKLRALALRL